MSDVVIKAENLGKKYTIGHQLSRAGRKCTTHVHQKSTRHIHQECTTHVHRKRTMYVRPKCTTLLRTCPCSSQDRFRARDGDSDDKRKLKNA